MTSKPSRPARCQHKPTTSCSLCRREHNELQQVGSWARDSNPKRTGSIDYASFIRDNPDALRTTTTKPHSAQPKPQPQSKKPPQHSQHINTTPQRPYKDHPSLSPTSDISTPFSRLTSPSSSVAATRANSPEIHRPSPRTVPVYNARLVPPASTNAAVVARSNLRAMAPQAATRFQANLPRTQIVESESEESDNDSSEESEEGDDVDDE